MRPDRSTTVTDALAGAALAACLLVIGLRGAGGTTPVVVPLLYLAVVTGELCRIDFAELRLPNALVVPGLVVAAGSAGWTAVADPDAGGRAAVAGGAYAAVLLGPALGGQAGMGDVKLALVLGLVLGMLGPWQAVLGPAAAFLSAGAVALAARVRGGGGDHLAFGPLMLGGFWGAVALSPFG